jgi:hypothetical protein
VDGYLINALNWCDAHGYQDIRFHSGGEISLFQKKHPAPPVFSCPPLTQVEQTARSNVKNGVWQQLFSSSVGFIFRRVVRGFHFHRILRRLKCFVVHRGVVCQRAYPVALWRHVLQVQRQTQSQD